MAYQAKRKKIYEEDLELTEEDGTVVHTLHVSLDPYARAKDLSVKYLDLQKAQQSLKHLDPQKNPEETIETAGKAAQDVLVAVFGERDAQTIIDFYNGRYTEMVREVFPFIVEVVMKVRKMAQEDRAATASKYNRKQRRAIGLFGK